MAAAVQQRLNQGAFLDEQRAGTLRRVDLVPGDRERVACDLLHVDGNFPGRLNGIGVEENIGLARDPADLLDRLHDSGFVVGHHDADQLGIRAQRFADVVGINFSAAAYGDAGNLAPRLFQTLAGVEHGVVLDGRSDHVVAAADETKNAQVIRLSPTAGKDHLRGTRVQQRSHRGPRLLYRRPRVLPVMVDGGCIAELLHVERPHRVKHFRQDGSGGVVVEVDSLHVLNSTLLEASRSIQHPTTYVRRPFASAFFRRFLPWTSAAPAFLSLCSVPVGPPKTTAYRRHRGTRNR